MDNRVMARKLAGEHMAAGDVLGWFEKLYAKAAVDQKGVETEPVMSPLLVPLIWQQEAPAGCDI
jgi:hypothetical protein